MVCICTMCIGDCASWREGVWIRCSWPQSSLCLQRGTRSGHQHTLMTSSLRNNNYVITIGEAAQQADVRVGDTVAKVDDTDVRRANAELVQNLIA